MTARGYELDEALRRATERIRRLEVTVARERYGIGAPPGGSAPGDIGGTPGAPAVTGIDGYPITGSPPAAGDTLVFNGTSWVEQPTSAPPFALEVFDEGVSLTSSLASLDFVGDGVTATASGDDVTVTIVGSFVPTYLSTGQTFVIPDNRQALFSRSIVLDAGASISIGVNAALIEVT